MAKSRTGRGKHSKGGAPRNIKRTRSKDQRKARRITRLHDKSYLRKLKNKARKVVA